MREYAKRVRVYLNGVEVLSEYETERIKEKEKEKIRKRLEMRSRILSEGMVEVGCKGMSVVTVGDMKRWERREGLREVKKKSFWNWMFLEGGSTSLRGFLDEMRYKKIDRDIWDCIGKKMREVGFSGRLGVWFEDKKSGWEDEETMVVMSYVDGEKCGMYFCGPRSKWDSDKGVMSLGIMGYSEPIEFFGMMYHWGWKGERLSREEWEGVMLEEALRGGL